MLDDGEIELHETPREAVFLAGKAFVSYRRRARGARRNVLPDFFIGAHAAVTGWSLLTRDLDATEATFPRSTW